MTLLLYCYLLLRFTVNSLAFKGNLILPLTDWESKRKIVYEVL
jgi:hypothetical protein